MDFLVIIIFILSAIGIYLSGEFVVNNIINFSRYIGLSPFIISFFLMGVSSALPNLFLGSGAAFKKIPELSLGDVFGNDFINLTIVISLAVLFSKYKKIQVKNLFIKQSVIFMILAALAPLFLVADGILSRYDGLFLLSLFGFYIWWSFSRQNYLTEKIYYSSDYKPLRLALKEWSAYASLLKIILGIIILFLSAQGIIYSAKFFASILNLPLVIIGILIVGFGNSLPETYFAISSSRKGETELIFGNMVGSVIAPATLVLGIVSIIFPIYINNFLFLEINRILYLLVIFILLWFILKKKEFNLYTAIILIGIYLLFLTSLKYIYFN
ncbi:MAG: hypothetical protein RMK17_02250 [bacterium]|nr:hypothetical protein [Patescibacteria group bacterium]MDW8279965.1 hypothetical protein [bacterium]